MGHTSFQTKSSTTLGISVSGSQGVCHMGFGSLDKSPCQMYVLVGGTVNGTCRMEMSVFEILDHGGRTR